MEIKEIASKLVVGTLVVLFGVGLLKTGSKELVVGLTGLTEKLSAAAKKA